MAQTVLVADDSVASQRLFEMVLTREGFEVVTVGTGAEVVSRIREKQPDLAFIDAVMPGVDGYQICQSVKKDPRFKHLPIIMLAGAYEDVDRQRGAAIVGAKAILEKPATSQVILSKVKEFLAAPSASAAQPVAPQAVPVKPVAAKLATAEVVPEPSFVEEEYEFDDDSEEVDLAVESELLEEEAEWEEADEGLADEGLADEGLADEGLADEGLDDETRDFAETFEDSEEIAVIDGDVDDVEAIEEDEDSEIGAAFADLSAAPQGAAPRPTAITDDELDALAAEIARRVAAQLGPALLHSLTAYVAQQPAVRHILEDASKTLAREILPDIQRSFK
jgi:CheY-like chemotaxis protein